jgi:hypothetical protein
VTSIVRTLFDFLSQFLIAKRLLDESGKSFSHKAISDVLLVVPAGDYNTGIGFNSSDFQESLFSAHGGHGQVEEDRDNFGGTLAKNLLFYLSTLEVSSPKDLRAVEFAESEWYDEAQLGDGVSKTGNRGKDARFQMEKPSRRRMRKDEQEPLFRWCNWYFLSFALINIPHDGL